MRFFIPPGKFKKKVLGFSFLELLGSSLLLVTAFLFVFPLYRDLGPVYSSYRIRLQALKIAEDRLSGIIFLREKSEFVPELILNQVSYRISEERRSFSEGLQSLRVKVAYHSPFCAGEVSLAGIF